VQQLTYARRRRKLIKKQPLKSKMSSEWEKYGLLLCPSQSGLIVRYLSCNQSLPKNYFNFLAGGFFVPPFVVGSPWQCGWMDDVDDGVMANTKG
jgi:hypothetical protein